MVIELPKTKSRKQLRLSAIEVLGGRCMVQDCPWDDPIVLEIDHWRGGGIIELERIGPDGVYKRVVEYPEDYLLLCASHHRLKTYLCGDLSKKDRKDGARCCTCNRFFWFDEQELEREYVKGRQWMCSLCRAELNVRLGRTKKYENR